MLSVRGIYENGEIKFKEKVSITGETTVIKTFFEDMQEEEDVFYESIFIPFI